MDEFRTRTSRFLYLADARRLIRLDDGPERRRRARRPRAGEWTFYERVDTLDAIVRVARTAWLSGVTEFVHIGRQAGHLLRAGGAALPRSRWLQVGVDRLRPRNGAVAIVPMELLTDASEGRRARLQAALAGFARVISYTGTRDWLTIGELAAKAGVEIADANAQGRAALIRAGS